MKYGNRKNGRETPSPVSFPLPPFFPVFFLFLFFSDETVHGRFIRDSVPVGTGFSRPIFNPTGVVPGVESGGQGDGGRPKVDGK
jgi:hypothetical protein